MNDLMENINTVKKDIASIKEGQKEQRSHIRYIKQILIKFGILDPVLESESPKKITERGQKLLHSHAIEDWLKDCPLVQKPESFKNKKELDIYLECLNFVDSDKLGQRKVAELMYENNIFKEQCRELLALSIRDKIFDILKKT